MHRSADARTDEPGSAAPATDAARGGRGRRSRAVWLRGNARPGFAAALAGLAASLLLALLLRPWDAPASWWAVVALPATVGGVLLAVAAAPRLRLAGDRLLVRVAPWRRHDVPIDVVECFFLGSRLEPPRVADGTVGGERVRTLVMRIAERATTHAAHPTFAPWGRWEEGSVTFDGRWCEPLSVDLVRRLNRALAAAKRGEDDA